MDYKIKDEFELYILMLLCKQSYEYGNSIEKGQIRHDLKQQLNLFLNSGKKLFDVIEKEFNKQGDNINERYWLDSELISRLFEFFSNKNKDIDKKNELFEIISLYLQGELKINKSE